MLFVYTILALSTASIQYIETIHRVTTGQAFSQNLFGSQLTDSLAALGFLLLFASLAFRSLPIKIASVAVFAGGITLYSAGSDMLQIIGLATVPAAAILVTAFSIARRLGLELKSPLFLPERSDARVVAGAFLIIIIILEVGALARWVTYPIYPTEIYSDASWRFAELESALFHSLALLSPFLVIFIGFSFFYKWHISDVLKRIGRALLGSNNPNGSSASSMSSGKPSTNFEGKTEHPDQNDPQTIPDVGPNAPVVATYAAKSSSITVRNAHWILLSAALIIAPLVAFYPHAPSINPDASGVSTDEQYYMNWMSRLRAESDAAWTSIIGSAFTINNGDRPMTLLIILAIANLTGSPDLMVIRYLPVALAPMLVFANYVLLKYSLRSKDETKLGLYAGLGSLFAVFSPQIVVGEYAGLLANWIGLIVANFAFYFLIKGWESESRNKMIHSFVILFAILCVIMLLHLYTWANLLAIMLLFAGISFIFTRKSARMPRLKILFMLLIVGVSFSVDYARSSYLATPAATGSDSAISTNIEPEDTTGRWDRLFFTLNTYVGGFLSNPAIFLLTLVWLARANLMRGLDRLILSMIFILAIPITVGSIEFQTRVLYNIPFHVPAILALFVLNDRDKGSRLLLVVTLALVFATYALRAMANLYLELPGGYILEDQFLLP